MAEPLRVLIVEDSENDTRLLVRELKRADYDVSFERVETAGSMRSALEGRKWDLVIADYTMPSFSAPAALSVLQQSGLDLPFIIVSGSIGEDVAVEAMRAGAHDYLLKGNLTRLLPAVQRELAQAAQRRTTRRAEESIQKLLRAVEQAGNAIFMTDPNGAINYVNPAFEEIYGYSRQEALGRTPRILKSGQRDQAFYERFWQRLLAGEFIREEFINKTREGRFVTVESSVSPVLDAQGRGIGFIAVQADVTERKRAEEGMRRSEERFRRLFESNTIGIAIEELSGRILEANDAYLDMLGYTREELLAGKLRWDELTPPDHRARDQVALEQLRTTGVAQPWEKEYLRKDGSRVPVLIGIAMLEASQNSCLAYFVDLSARRLLEEQLRLSQKMEAVGQLAGGVAHDFNNLLTVILGFGNLLAARLASDASGREEVEEILRAAERAAALTQQLLAFSRKQVLEPVVLEVNELVRNLEKMLRRLVGEDLELATGLDPSAGRVRADPGQLEQVIVNLVVNARDAMPRGGKLTIETANADFDEAYAQHHASVRPGRYVMVAVSDTGVGMDAETQARIFEPFFTTKEKGKGTGLGLSTVYGIVKQSGGNIWVTSEPGKGTTLEIYLPIVDDVVADGVPFSSESLPAASTETILLVEDEESVRTLSRRILEKHGYRVLEASSGEAALEKLRECAERIHLLLTDLVMPAMAGTELASRLKAEHPDLRVLFMSGYTDDAVVRSGLLSRGHAFLQKPFTPSGLVRKVRDVLLSPDSP